MDILFYRYDGIQNKVNKRLGESVTLQGNIDISSEVMNPIIRISRADDVDFTFVKYNYLCINSGSTSKDFGNRPRYYFITDKDEKFTLLNMPTDFRRNPKLYKIMKDNVIPILETNLSGISPEEMEIAIEEEEFYNL